MIGPTNNDINDARLVAFLDGELSRTDRAAVARALEADPDMRERLELLESGGRPFAAAFDVLLEAAPDDRLQAMFASLVSDDVVSASPARDAAPPGRENVVPLRRPTSPGSRPLWQLAAAAAVTLMVFGGGVTTGYLWGPEPVAPQPPAVPQVQPPVQPQVQPPVQPQVQPPVQPPVVTAAQPPAPRGWREAVAQYVSLFSEQTLAGMPTDNRSRTEGLRRVSAALALTLSADKIATPSLEFKGTQLLQLEGKPIAQIAYLSQTGKPVALCIIKTANAAHGSMTEKRHGLNIVHWIANGYGFMVLGDVPDDALLRISQSVKARLS